MILFKIFGTLCLRHNLSYVFSQLVKLMDLLLFLLKELQAHDPAFLKHVIVRTGFLTNVVARVRNGLGCCVVHNSQLDRVQVVICHLSVVRNHSCDYSPTRRVMYDSGVEGRVVPIWQKSIHGCIRIGRSIDTLDNASYWFSFLGYSHFFSIFVIQGTLGS